MAAALAVRWSRSARASPYAFGAAAVVGHAVGGAGLGQRVEQADQQGTGFGAELAGDADVAGVQGVEVQRVRRLLDGFVGGLGAVLVQPGEDVAGGAFQGSGVERAGVFDEQVLGLDALTWVDVTGTGGQGFGDDVEVVGAEQTGFDRGAGLG